MEAEDVTPHVEDRSILEALEVLELNTKIKSIDTTPSSEEASLPCAIPGNDLTRPYAHSCPTPPLSLPFSINIPNPVQPPSLSVNLPPPPFKNEGTLFIENNKKCVKFF